MKEGTEPSWMISDVMTHTGRQLKFQAQPQDMALTVKVQARKKIQFFFFPCCVQPHSLQRIVDLDGLKSFSKELQVIS